MTKDSSVVNSGPSKYSPPVMVSKCLKHMVIVVCVMANLREHMNATKKNTCMYMQRIMFYYRNITYNYTIIITLSSLSFYQRITDLGVVLVS